MPGRNGPCPCGSGRKYKNCCLRADRKAQRAGAGDHGLTPEALEHVRRQQVWQTELVPFAASFEDAPGARPAVAMVTASDLVIWADVLRCPAGEPAEVARVLGEAVLAAGKRVGCMPARLEARHAEVVEGLREHLGGQGVEVSAKRRLAHLDRAAESLVEHLEGRPPEGPGPSRPCASAAETWGAWLLPPGTVAEVFEAAAAFYRGRPWRALDDSAELELETPGGRRWSASVMGAGGIQYGLSIYSDPEDRRLLFEGPAGAVDMGGFVGRCLSLTFDHANDLPAPMRREIMRSGWTVAGTEAYPHLLTINTPGGGVTDADARDLAVALRAVVSGAAAVAADWERGGAAEWTDPQSGAVVRLFEWYGGPAGPPDDTWSDAPDVDQAVAERLELLIPMLVVASEAEDLPEELMKEAIRLTIGYAAADPDAFLAGYKPGIVAAAAVHAAGLALSTPWSGWRPTLEDLAEMWGVSPASISKRSVEIRRLVLRPGR